MADLKRTIIVATAVIIAVALVLVVVLCVNSETHNPIQNPDGVIIDFEEYQTSWAETSLQNVSAEDALRNACSILSYTVSFNDDGTVEEINGIHNTSEIKWNLWVVENGKNTWKKMSAPYDYSVREYAAVCWAYRENNDTPTIAVDMCGRSFYNLENISRTITLSSTITEDLCAIGGLDTIVGTDLYSDYPKEIKEGQESGKIAIVGDFVTPNFEEIVKCNPDVVFCDSSQYNHNQVCDRLNNSGINAYLLYNPVTPKVIKDNVFMLGVATGHYDEVKALFNNIDKAMEEMQDKISSSPYTQIVKVAFSLSGDVSPWVAGSNTYVDSVTDMVCGNNVFNEYSGWTQVNSEQILSRNPSKIIVVLDTGIASKEYYDEFISSLPAEWKGTDAYKNGEIYILCEGAAQLGMRESPRYIQLAELMGRILNPDVFDDIQISKYIGDNYRDYLSYTKELGV